MKKINPIYSMIIVLTMVAAFPAKPAVAANAMAELLVDTGLRELEKGDKDAAIHEFSKALMLEPDNQEARRQLKLLGLDEGIYADSPTAVGRKSHSNSAVNRYRAQIAQLQNDKAQLEQQLQYSQREIEEPSPRLLREAYKLEQEVIQTKKPFHLTEVENPRIQQQRELDAQINITDDTFTELARNIWSNREHSTEDYSQSDHQLMDEILSREQPIVKARNYGSTDEEFVQNAVAVIRQGNAANAGSENLAEVIEVIAVDENNLETVMESGIVYEPEIVPPAPDALAYQPDAVDLELQMEADDYSFMEDTISARDAYHDLQTALNISATQEMDFHLLLNDDTDSLLFDQFAYQDRLIQMLDDYLQVREAVLEDTKDELLATSLELNTTELELLGQIRENQEMNRVYGNLIKYVDDQPFLVSEENSYTEFLRRKLDLAQDQLIEQSSKIAEQGTYLVSLENQLEESRYRIDRLLEEREELLNTVVREVQVLQRQPKRVHHK